MAVRFILEETHFMTLYYRWRDAMGPIDAWADEFRNLHAWVSEKYDIDFNGVNTTWGELVFKDEQQAVEFRLQML